MYDIQIFIEDNWQFAWRVQIEDEIIYALADNPSDLIEQIKELLEDIIKVKDIKNNSKLNKILMYLNYHNATNIQASN